MRTRVTKAEVSSGPGATGGEAIALRVVDRIVEENGHGKGSAIAILQAIQPRFCYLPTAALVRVCEVTDITPAQIEGVSTFYSQFRHMPVGKHLVSVCHGTACHVAGAEAVTEAVRRHLGIEGDADTGADGLFTVQVVSCLGCCSPAPVMRIDKQVYGRLNPQTAPRAIERFLREEPARAFLAKQRHIVLERCGQMDPVDIDDYLACDGYTALEESLRTMSAEDVIQAVKASGLRGRGGAGYLGGRKWEQVRREQGGEQVRRHEW